MTPVLGMVAADQRQPCEVWTRVMGYHRPVSAFNPGKRAEYAERQCFTEGAADASSWVRRGCPKIAPKTR